MVCLNGPLYRNPYWYLGTYIASDRPFLTEVPMQGSSQAAFIVVQSFEREIGDGHALVVVNVEPANRRIYYL